MSSRRSERFQVMLSEAELVALKDWQFKHHMPSRAAAVRELIRRGLGETSANAHPDARSKAFGVD